MMQGGTAQQHPTVSGLSMVNTNQSTLMANASQSQPPSSGGGGSGGALTAEGEN